MIIAELKTSDYDDWLPLWRANMEQQVSDDVTALTWKRICDTGFPIGGLGARMEDGGKLCGICHFIIHPTTGNSKFICYMQDLYVDPSARRKGVARALIMNLAAMGKLYDWARIYWLAEAKNEEAQRLYRTLGLKLDFTLHVLPIA